MDPAPGRGFELYSQGNEFGDNEALREAIAAYRAALATAPGSSEPFDAGPVHRDLGVALTKLGNRTGEAALLEESIAAFGDA